MFHKLTIFAQMIGRYLEHLFGFTAPFSGSRAPFSVNVQGILALRRWTMLPSHMFHSQ